MPLGAMDTATEAFAARLARLLRTARADQGTSLRAMARATAGAATGRQLRAIEAAEADLTQFDVAAIVTSYGLELSSLLGERVPIAVDLDVGVLHTVGITRHFTPGDVDALLTAYLGLVRDLRGVLEGSVVALRRDDVEVLARHLQAETATILDRLAVLMGATSTERRSIAALFASGAAVLVLTTSAIATEPGLHRDVGDTGPGRDVVTVSTILDAVEHRAAPAAVPSSWSRDTERRAVPVSPMTPPPPPI